MKPPGPCTVGLQWAWQVGVWVQCTMFVVNFVYLVAMPDAGHNPLVAFVLSLFLGMVFSWVTVCAAVLAGMGAMVATAVRGRPTPRFRFCGGAGIA